MSSTMLRAYFAPMPAERLGAIRVLVGAYALVYLVARLPHLLRYAAYDASAFAPIGVLAFLDAPLPSPLYLAAVALALGLALPFALGVRHRLLAPAFALALLVVLTYTNCFGQILHTDNLLVLHVGVLALAPAGDALALSSRGRPAQPAHARYGWPVRLLCAITVMVYLLAGVAKLRHGGLAYFDGESLRNYIAFDNVRKLELGSVHSPLGAWLLPYTGLFSALSLATLALELGAPLALVHARVGRAWALVVWSFHLGVLLLMAIAFVYPLTGVAFAAFFEAERLPLLRRLAARSAAPGADAPVEVAGRATEREAREA